MNFTMPSFCALPLKIKQILVGYFEDMPIGTKIKYGFTLRGVPVSVNANGVYVFKNSYIKLEKDIYALGRGEQAIVGEGTSGKVKYVQSLSSNILYVVKILRYIVAESKLDCLKSEIKVLDDLGLYRDGGSRNESSTKKQYIVMPNAGMSLDKYIELYPELNNTTRYDLAIKLCWSVHNLHRGNTSRTSTRYAHRDIKPQNIVIKDDSVQLIDVGTCQVNPDNEPEDWCRTDAYLPNLNTYLHIKMTARKLDVLALKRVIYMPHQMLCFQGYKEDLPEHHFGMQRIFSQDLLYASGLSKHFDTSAKANQTKLRKGDLKGDPLIFASYLVLSLYGLMERYATKVTNPILAYAVLGLYFANQGMSETHVRSRLASMINAYVLCKVVPRYEVLTERTRLLALLVETGIINNLNDALNNETLLSLLKMPSVLIQRAATLLWKNGFYEPSFLIQLSHNEDLARNVIKSVFDGDLKGVKKMLSPPIPQYIEKPVEVRGLHLPTIAVIKAIESKSQSERTHVRNKVSERFPSRFFAIPNEKKKPEAGGVEHVDQRQSK